VKSTPFCSIFFSLLNEASLKNIDRKMAEKEAKKDLPDFLGN
jgi:hypothetical protein